MSLVHEALLYHRSEGTLTTQFLADFLGRSLRTAERYMAGEVELSQQRCLDLALIAGLPDLFNAWLVDHRHDFELVPIFDPHELSDPEARAQAHVEGMVSVADLVQTIEDALEDGIVTRAEMAMVRRLYYRTQALIGKVYRTTERMAKTV